MRLYITFVVLVLGSNFVQGENIFSNLLSIVDGEIKEKQCQNQLREYILGLKNGKYWALQMWDSTSKLQSGILDGNTADIGNFDECLSVKADTNYGKLAGKYCLGTLSLNVAVENDTSKYLENFRDTEWAVCVPNTCSSKEISKLLSVLLSSITEMYGIGNREFIKSSSLTFEENLCQTAESRIEYTKGVIVILALFVILISLIILITVYQIYFECFMGETVVNKVLLPFSLWHNGKILFGTQVNPELSCLSGIRVITLVWIAWIHHFFVDDAFSRPLSKNLYEWSLTWESRLVFAARNSVDSFLTMGGLLVSYNFLKSAKRGEAFNLFKFYIHRIVRIVPGQAVMMISVAYFLEHIVHGPRSPLFVFGADVCKKILFPAVFLYQNTFPELSFRSTCLPHLWYFNVDMQLYLLSPVFLLLVKKYRRVGTGFLIFVIVSLVLYTFANTFRNNLDLLYFTKNDAAFRSAYYYRTLTRASPWLIGLLCGFFIHKLKETGIKLQKSQIIKYWFLSISTVIFMIFYPATIQDTDHTLETSLYYALASPAWSIAICWMIVACIFGYGGPINTFLSHPVFQFLAKFCYSWYVCHIVVAASVLYSSRYSVSATGFHKFYIYVGELFCAWILGAIWTLLFENPPIALEKLLWEKKKKI